MSEFIEGSSISFGLYFCVIFLNTSFRKAVTSDGNVVCFVFIKKYKISKLYKNFLTISEQVLEALYSINFSVYVFATFRKPSRRVLK